MKEVRDVPVVFAHTNPETGEVVEVIPITVQFPDAVPLIESLVRHEGKHAKALQELGLSMSTWRRYLATPELGDALRDIMSFYDEVSADEAEDVVREQVRKGDKDTAKWMLERVRGEKYSTKQKVDTDVRVTVRVKEF